MVNIIFIIIHIAALIWMWWLLLITIPLHIICARLGGDKELPDYLKHDGQKKCRACAEWIQKEAVICKHCGMVPDERPLSA